MLVGVDVGHIGKDCVQHLLGQGGGVRFLPRGGDGLFGRFRRCLHTREDDYLALFAPALLLRVGEHIGLIGVIVPHHRRDMDGARLARLPGLNGDNFVLHFHRLRFTGGFRGCGFLWRGFGRFRLWFRFFASVDLGQNVVQRLLCGFHALQHIVQGVEFIIRFFTVSRHEIYGSLKSGEKDTVCVSSFSAARPHRAGWPRRRRRSENPDRSSWEC